MLRIHGPEQVLIQKAAREHPGPLADWLIAWVDAQLVAPPSKGIDISEIPIPQADDSPTIIPASSPPPSTRRDLRAERDALLEEIGYKEMPLPQRKAIRKFLDSGTVTEIVETDRYPDDENCWLGTHKMEGWEELDFHLWLVTGVWNSGIPIKKWGCKDCAMAIHKVHPYAKLVHYA